MSTEKDIAERLRAAFVQHHGNKVGDPFVSQIAREIAAVASGIEARSGGTAKPARSEGREPVPKGTPILSVVGAARSMVRAFDNGPGTVLPVPTLRAALSAYDAAPRVGVEEIERMIVAAYERGAQWAWENADWRGFLPKAARDYADAALSTALPAEVPPALPDASQYYATDKSGQWHYVNHAGAWQTCPPPFSSALPADERARIRNAALEEAFRIAEGRAVGVADEIRALKTKD